MIKKANQLYDELNKAENRLLSIRSQLVRGELTPEFAAISIRKVSIELADLAVSVFPNALKK